MPIHEPEESIQERIDEASRLINYSPGSLYVHLNSNKLYQVLGFVVDHDTLAIKVAYRVWDSTIPTQNCIEWVLAVKPFSQKFQVFKGHPYDPNW